MTLGNASSFLELTYQLPIFLEKKKYHIYTSSTIEAELDRASRARVRASKGMVVIVKIVGFTVS